MGKSQEAQVSADICSVLGRDKIHIAVYVAQMGMNCSYRCACSASGNTPCDLHKGMPCQYPQKLASGKASSSPYSYIYLICHERFSFLSFRKKKPACYKQRACIRFCPKLNHKTAKNPRPVMQPHFIPRLHFIELRLEFSLLTV